ncbi:MAG: hypothetical protein KA436_11710 [Oligoflexales bacterium]|nr:hypothetical protein [Oligoflexales bacterium]
MQEDYEASDPEWSGTRHGRFEKISKRGKHQGEYDLDLNSKGGLDNSGGHDIEI